MIERHTLLPVLALTFNAFTWGVSWAPFRWLEARGLHALWATAVVYALAVVFISAWRPRAWPHLLRTPSLWWLVAAAGLTNATFNWAVTLGDVVRVVLLFYLMPLWAVLLARGILGERLTLFAALRVLLALAGACIVLWPDDGSWVPVPRHAAEWLGLAGGFCFALNNVMLRREAAQPEEARALAMFVGGVGVSGALALALGGAGGAVSAPSAGLSVWVAAALLAAAFLLSNLALQYGAAKLPANVTAVVMLTEVFFASASAVAAGAGSVTWALAAGGAMIVSAALLAAWRPPSR